MLAKPLSNLRSYSTEDPNKFRLEINMQSEFDEQMLQQLRSSLQNFLKRLQISLRKHRGYYATISKEMELLLDEIASRDKQSLTISKFQSLQLDRYKSLQYRIEKLEQLKADFENMLTAITEYQHQQRISGISGTLVEDFGYLVCQAFFLSSYAINDSSIPKEEFNGGT